MRILAIDPSGTGTNGIFYTNGKEELFNQYKDIYWKNHYTFIASLVKLYKPDLLLFENSNYISNRSKDSLNLIRLLGSIEVLKVPSIESINVLKVKELSKALFSGKAQIPKLEYQPGRGKGWLWKGERISIHCLEAFLVYYLFSNKS